MNVTAKHLQPHAPLAQLDMALFRGGVPVEVLQETDSSGVPLLVRWWQHHLTRDPTSWYKAGESANFQAALGWKLIDSGFDVTHRWQVTEHAPFFIGTTRVWSAASGPAGSSQDLLDVFLRAGDLQLLSALQRRWPVAWEAADLAKRSVGRYSQVWGMGTVPCLHLDAEANRQEMLKWWHRMGVDLNLRDAEGRTPLFHATEAPAVDRLLSLGADPSACDLTGVSVFDHWLNSKLSKPEALVFRVFSKARHAVSPEVLARSVAMANRHGSFLTNPVRSSLVALRPYLTIQYFPQEDGSSRTLLEEVMVQTWSLPSHPKLEILRWLVANTPKAGLEQVRAYAELALAAFHRLSEPSSPPRVDVAKYLESVRALTQAPCSQPSVYALICTGRALLDMAAQALTSSTPDLSPATRDKVGPIPSSLKDWLSPVPTAESSRCLLAQSFACVAALDSWNVFSSAGAFHAWGGAEAQLIEALWTHIASAQPIPRDTLAPALQLLAVWPEMPDGWAAPTLPSLADPPPGHECRLKGLSEVLAWWVLKGVAEHSTTAIAAEEWSQSLALLRRRSHPWPEWAAAWEKRRLEAEVSPANPVPRTPRRF